MTPGAPSQDLALALDQARESALASQIARRPETLEEAQRTAQLLYERLRGRGARQVGWKLGATDAAAQTKLGTDRPFLAPVHDVMSAPLGTPISRGRLIAPLLEVEIAVDLGGSSPALRPCAELADSRFPNWVSSLPEVIADFGLQGLMLLGEPVAPVEAMAATVWRDDELLATGTRTFAEALALAELVEGRHGAFVATGTITPPVPLTIGHWRIELGELGSIAFEVTPWRASSTASARHSALMAALVAA